MEAGFSLGSNLGDRVACMREAKRRLLELPDVAFVGQSPLYETEPVGVPPEYAHLPFLNAVLVVASDRTARDWLADLRAVEDQMGRRRDADRNAPRPIDIDLLYAGDACIDGGDVVVPHPRWAERRFVVEPLATVRPELVLPGCHRTVRAVLQELVGEQVARLDTEW